MARAEQIVEESRRLAIHRLDQIRHLGPPSTMAERHHRNGSSAVGGRDRAPVITDETAARLQRQKAKMLAAGNPRTNALFGVLPETCGSRRLGGGVRSQMRTRLH